VPDTRQKIDLYRRLTQISGAAEFDALCEELNDRFGQPPAEAVRLLNLVQIKLAAAHWRIHDVHVEDRHLVLHYRDGRRIAELAARAQGKIKVVDDRSAYLALPQEVTQPDALIDFVRSVLRPA
jgi:transcription-repair coupling factor (superfamily II helicase)